jgi:hypothetical protein
VATVSCGITVRDSLMSSTWAGDSEWVTPTVKSQAPLPEGMPEMTPWRDAA